MRPGQNKRMRGRNNNNNNRKGPNPLTRSYESNGPDVKIRGTAHHIGEKYLQLARDAQSSGDPVMAESYLQHAEHYFRLIAAAQLAQQQAAQGYQQRPGDPVESDDEDGDEDFVSLPDRFASPSEQRINPNLVHQPQPFQDRPQPDRQFQDRERQPQPYVNGHQPQPYESRQGRQYDRPQGGGHPYGDRPQGERQERQYDNRGRGQYGDRPFQDRGGQDQSGQDRSQDRSGQERSGQHERGPQGERGGERPAREGEGRNFRGNRRDFRDQPREPRGPVEDAPAAGLPAFITGPSRTTPGDEPQPGPSEAVAVPGEASGEDTFHLRPRRRRRPKQEFASEAGEGRTEHEPASDPVGD